MKFEPFFKITLMMLVVACHHGGHRIDLSPALELAPGQFAQLYLPENLAPANKITLVVHFHGATRVIEEAVNRTHANVILLNVHLGAFSSPYRKYFADSTRFPQTLVSVKNELRSRKRCGNPEIGRVILSAFSAGYAAVREILKNPEIYPQIHGLALADGLHANLEHAIMESQMRDFVRFARDARDRKKILCLTHSSIPTPDYASTTVTADYLLAQIGAVRQPCRFRDEIGAGTSVCDTGNFHLKGYAGETAADHLHHFYRIDGILKSVLNPVGADENCGNFEMNVNK